MKALLRQAISGVRAVLGARNSTADAGSPLDASPQDQEILRKIAGFTMTSTARQMSLIGAVRHIAKSDIRGSIVECGVWRGGSSMAIALTLMQEGNADRDLVLFDTFEGMTEPLEVDRTPNGALAKELMEKDPDRRGEVWAVATYEDVLTNMRSTGYDGNRLRLVKGPVESTIPEQAPAGPIALLRLDTDWYESTKHELEHLFPKLVSGGVLIIDDYGHWQGARKAVDEYLQSLPDQYFLHRIDYTGRLLVKR